MKFNLPMIKEKIAFFEEIRNHLNSLKILYNKNAAQIKHLSQLSKRLADLRQHIGETLFDQPQMNQTSQIITSQDDEFMKTMNEKYEGAGGSSLNNCIQGFHEKRKIQKVTVFGKLMKNFGSSIKEIFVQQVPIENYTYALLDLIRQTYYIEEWLSCVLALSK